MLHILSLGAGVQSTTLLLMALHGEITPMPDAAIFADTGWEPAAVYAHLDWCEQQMAGRIPLYRVSRGNLHDDYLRMAAIEGDLVAARKAGAVRFASMPVFVKNQDATEGYIRRQCTKEYKIQPIRSQSRALMTAAGVKHMTQWIGISLDEATRMKPSGMKSVTHRWPLIEVRMTRADCLLWLERHGYPRPPRSACLGCPFHNDSEWRAIKARPDDWANVVAFDAAIRRLPGMDGDAYLHSARVPLPMVDLSTPQDHGQLELWDAECEGMCGV